MNYLRPDELATETEIEKSKKRDKTLKSGIKTGVGLAGAALGITSTGKMASKILPFLSQYIPEDLAFKGINKVSPNLGEFLKFGMKQGLDLKSGLNFLSEKFNSSQKKAPEQKNIISQYDDKLNAFLEDQIKQGRSPLEAGALAQLNDKFKTSIKKMEQDHKTNFSSILQSIFGGGEQASQKPQQPQMTQQPQQPQQNQGNTDAALMAALDKILKM